MWRWITQSSSQGLLDIYTLIKFFPKELNPDILKSKKILVIEMLIILESQDQILRKAFGAEIILCGPPSLVSDDFKNYINNPDPNKLEDPIKSRSSITVSRSLEDSIRIADAIIVLRLQKERMIDNVLSSIDSYSYDYGLTSDKLLLNGHNIPVLHPGPINRDIEISSEIVDKYPNCLINNQVSNGIPIRMALLYLLRKLDK